MMDDAPKRERRSWEERNRDQIFRKTTIWGSPLKQAVIKSSWRCNLEEEGENFKEEERPS